jgi:Excalibur calcium-binding domain
VEGRRVRVHPSPDLSRLTALSRQRATVTIAVALLLAVGTACQATSGSVAGHSGSVAATSTTPAAQLGTVSSTPPAGTAAVVAAAPTTAAASTSQAVAPPAPPTTYQPPASVTPPPAAPVPPAGARTYPNCAALNADYPHGVGRTGAVDHVSSGTPVTTFTVDDAVYNANTGRDRDGDGIACEQD